MSRLIPFEITGFILCALIYNLFSTLLNWGLLYIGIYYMTANAVSYITGVLMAYFLNTRFVFKKKYSLLGCFKFCSVYFSNFIITMILTYGFVNFLKISAYLAPIIIMVFSSGYNFFMSKFVVFKKEEPYEKNYDTRGK